MHASNPAKIQRPALPEISVRERLLALIDQNADKRVCWISGPGGAGKTTFVNSYIEERNLPCLWYQVDGSDNDLAGFFHYLGRAGMCTSTGRETVFPSFTPEYSFGVREFSRNFFAALAGIQPPDVCLVLDNCQELADDAGLYDAVLSGVTQLGTTCKIIFISRNELAAPLYRLRANNELCQIGWLDLRLTVEEAVDFSKVKHLGFNSKQLQRLHTLLDGWAAGFQIVAGVDNIGAYLSSSSETILEDSKENIFTYFAEETFRHLDNTTQAVLLKTSILPYIDLAMVEGVSAINQAGSVIKELCRTNIFISRQAGQPGVYHYHQLFKEFLQNRYRSYFSAAERRETLSNAASLFIEQEKIEEGISLHIQAGNWMDVISLISEHGPALLKQGRFKTLGSWLQCFPDDIAGTNPWVKYWSATCLMLQDPLTSQSLFDESLEIFKEQQDVVGMYLTLSGMGESLAYRFDSFVHYDQWILALEALSDQYPDFPSVEIEARIALVMMTAIGLRQPAYVHADEWRTRAMALVNANGLEGSLRIHLINSLILERTLTGYLNEADLLMTMFKKTIENQPIPPIVHINLKNFEALLNWRRGRSEACSRAVAEGLALAEETGVHVISFILLANGVSAALAGGDMKQAERLSARMEAQLDKAGAYGRVLYHFTMSWKYFLENAIAKANAQCEQALLLAAVVGNPEATAISYLVHAIILMTNGESKSAVVELEKAFRLCEENPIHQGAFGCHLTKAELHFSAGHSEQGLLELQKGLSVGSRMGFSMFPLWRDGAISELCVRALECAIHQEYVQWLIRERSLFPSHAPVHLENWPWAVKVYCLGDLKIVIDNEILKFKGKSQQKPLELLKALIALGGRNIPETRISDILWPDADGDMQQQSFNTTLHRLRKILKAPDVLILSSGQLSLNEERCWCDVWAFRCLLDTPQEYLSFQGTREEEALKHYRGPFLQNETAWWAGRLREKLQGQAISIIELVAQGYMENALWNKAVPLYEKGLEIEGSNAEFSLQLMQCYSNLGHKASAINVYDTFMKKFGHERGLAYHNIQKKYHEILGNNVNCLIP